MSDPITLTDGTIREIALRIADRVSRRMQVPRLLGIAAANRYSGISTRTLQQLQAEGRIKRVRDERGREMFRRDDLDRYIEALPYVEVGPKAKG